MRGRRSGPAGRRAGGATHLVVIPRLRGVLARQRRRDPDVPAVRAQLAEDALEAGRWRTVVRRAQLEGRGVRAADDHVAELGQRRAVAEVLRAARDHRRGEPLRIEPAHEHLPLPLGVRGAPRAAAGAHGRRPRRPRHPLPPPSPHRLLPARPCPVRPPASCHEVELCGKKVSTNTILSEHLSCKGGGSGDASLQPARQRRDDGDGDARRRRRWWRRPHLEKEGNGRRGAWRPDACARLRSGPRAPTRRLCAPPARGAARRGACDGARVLTADGALALPVPRVRRPGSCRPR